MHPLFKATLIGFGVALGTVGGVALAVFSVPHPDFQPGTPISSGAIEDNFNSVNSGLNTLQAQLDTLNAETASADALAALEDRVVQLTTELDSVDTRLDVEPLRYTEALGTVSAGISDRVRFWHPKFGNSDNAYDPVSGTFRCLHAGTFEVRVSVGLTGNCAAGNSGALVLYKNDSQQSMQYVDNQFGSTSFTVSIADIVQCDTGDEISVHAASDCANAKYLDDERVNWITIVEVGR